MTLANETIAERIRGLRQDWPKPTQPRPIVILGAGGIVRDSHLPAYRKGGFIVAAIFDLDIARATQLATQFGIAQVCDSLEQALTIKDAVFDLALPPEALLQTIQMIPLGATVLIQKPLGIHYDQALAIAGLCQQRNLIAAVNFQLRFSPMMLALRAAIEQDLIGDIVDVEVRLACHTPWELWPFMAALPQVETLMHSIHYMDWIRGTLGEPRSVMSLSVPHPDHPTLADARTSTILDYPGVRCCLSLNHTYRFGPQHQDASIRIEGVRGAAIVSLGLLLDYPRGAAETLQIISANGDWTDVPLQGRWFPDAFVGIMSNLQRYAAGEDTVLLTAVDDAVRTMALVDACKISSERGGVAPRQDSTKPY
ncbi:Gfo/Idh/MocA family protein [Glaciimonas sp. PCH181]|uniref:Gfo/Idh/MocA family protein n=1 Tax=Glaciimonas sp. PCH181 TaxID=2133943 RepID=UPI000D335E89|nr:Gfo/Idh/MocA family oxidoreductase [Glaciimonas sp. PCH181]PUA18877.1 oxidoreductase [Glaciimonas sp. PCH181]